MQGAPSTVSGSVDATPDARVVGPAPVAIGVTPTRVVGATGSTTGKGMLAAFLQASFHTDDGSSVYPTDQVVLSLQVQVRWHCVYYVRVPRCFCSCAGARAGSSACARCDGEQ